MFSTRFSLYEDLKVEGFRILPDVLWEFLQSIQPTTQEWSQLDVPFSMVKLEGNGKIIDATPMFLSWMNDGIMPTCIDDIFPIAEKPEGIVLLGLLKKEKAVEFCFPIFTSKGEHWVNGKSCKQSDGTLSILLQSVHDYVSLHQKYVKLKNTLDEQHIIKEELKIQQFQQNERLESITQLLMDMVKDQDIQLGNWDESLSKIVTQLAQFLGITRVSVWEYKSESKSICSIQYYNQGVVTRDPIEIVEATAPIYFSAILNQQVILSEDAQENKWTKEFTDFYLKPLQIKSMLDVPFFIEDRLGGIICCEQQYTSYSWTPEDVLLARGMADIITIAWKSNQRKLAEQTIVESKEKIKQQNRILEVQRDEIRWMNERLEEKVKNRTEELFIRNKQLEEYAFMNAHKLRGPLCRLKGLIYLFQKDPNAESYRDELIHYITVSAEELDAVVHQITQKLHENYTKE
ncbi:MAG: GAF domain-containing protein [Cytophagaceae bacterium]|jgi:predicted nuclease with TOPRIM domain|nr:GAF domain-containing protein [Cytophagaceae bacterium]